MHGVGETFRWAAWRLHYVCKWCGKALQVRRELFGFKFLDVCQHCNLVITPVDPVILFGDNHYE